MTHYEFLLAAKQSGLLQLLWKEFGFPTHYHQWMKIYAYHLEHPTLSQWQVALNFNISKHMVWETYRFMSQEIVQDCYFSFPH